MLSIAETIVRTDVGRHRSDNEDAALARPPVFVIADGMGGAQAGEVASQIAIDAFAAGLPADGAPEQRLRAVVERANREIHRRSQSEAENSGMGTTLTAAMLSGDEVALAHVGDSRAYLLRDGELRRLTEDHSLVEELVRGGRLTEEQALEHPQRSVITRALGIEAEVAVDTWTYPLRPGDLVLLCSDGLTDMLREDQIRDALVASGDLADGAERLVVEANAAGGRDNITVVLFRVMSSELSDSVEQPTEVRPGVASASSDAQDPEGHELAAAAAALAASKGWEPPAVTPAPSTERARRAPLARRQGGRVPRGFVSRPGSERHFGALGKLVATLVAVGVVVFVIGGAGYLATRQLYFLGTNRQGAVVIFRGLPYVLPFGVPMYETFYVSGVPAQTLPADRRSTLLSHTIRGQTSAIRLINDLELGKISG